jgi:septum formation protein
MRPMRLILASASPRRAEILRGAQIPFEVCAACVDESLLPGESPRDYVQRLAFEKAKAAAQISCAHDSDVVFLGADTVVVAGNEIFGKPKSPPDARRMLKHLSGAVHDVHTGVALYRPVGRIARVADEVTRVTFAPMTEAEIEAYIATDEPMDKAGAYAIQGIGGKYITKIEGCYFNVVGLPLARLWSLLRDLAWTSPGLG